MGNFAHQEKCAARPSARASKLLNTGRSWLPLALAALLLSSCASNEINTPSTPDDKDMDMSTPTAEDMASGDMSRPAPMEDMGNASDQGALDMTSSEDEDMTSGEDQGGEDADMGDVDQDMPIESIDYVVCAIGAPDPMAACQPEDILDFGSVPDGMSATLAVRITNNGSGALTVASAMTPAPFTSTFALFSAGQSAETSLPHELATGESGYFLVTLQGSEMMEMISGVALEITLEVGEQGSQEMASIALQGARSGCAPGFADCDGLPGCEVDTTSNASHCGMCMNACVLDNTRSTSCDMSACKIGICEDNFRDCDQNPATGCEIDIKNTKEHCGGCGKACDFANADEACDMGTCQFQGCDAGFENCDGDLALNGCEAELATDEMHCGGCNQPCFYTNAGAECQNNTCTFQGCSPDYYDINNDLSDGCEYFCQFQSSTDLPDPNYIDSNCDGIDGDISRAVFVSPTGSNMNAGTRDAPYLTIGKALSVAAISGIKDQVLVDAGTYQEQVFLVNGVSVAGGYERALGWQRTQFAIPRVVWGQASSGRVVAMQGTNINQPTLLEQIEVEAQAPNTAGTTIYGMHCAQCSGLTIRRCTIRATDGVSGVPGSPGSNGANGGNGGNGGSGSCDGSGWGPGGSGGSSSCGKTGGNGGRGGTEGRNNGVSGSPGMDNMPGGFRGSGGDPGGDGANGTNGMVGASGTNGQGGFEGSVIGGYWVGDDGNSGTDGQDGNGGGGGGGGGGQGCTFCNNGSGNGGGGGGGGGCKGTAGSRGSAGGSSFGLFLFSSNGITLEENTISSGNGGNGGAGGDGGDGGARGLKGTGNSHCSSEIGEGGDGGNGGAGGDGGAGGGGAGGYSYAIYRESTVVGLPGTNTLSFGAAGSGGPSEGNAGSQGRTGPYR